MAHHAKNPRVHTLFDLLSRLNHRAAVRLLGSEGEGLLIRGGKIAVDLAEDVSLTKRRFRVRAGGANVTVAQSERGRGRLEVRCSSCARPCEHAGATLSLLLEEKLALGLAAPPDLRVPIEHLTPEQLVERAVAERKARAKEERMRLTSSDPKTPWTDYVVTSAASGKSYRVALRGRERGVSYCSCPDFRKNTLGTCKHVLHALAKVERKFPKRALARPYRRKNASVYVRYGERLELRVALPDRAAPDLARLFAPFVDAPANDVHALLQVIAKAERAAHDVRIHPDAEEHINGSLRAERVANLVASMRKDPIGHPLRKSLLRVELLPYQLDGIAFAVGAGRAILADDMGLGKTIQGIGVAELLARECEVERVLVVCPTSLKAQWESEIARFSRRTSQIVAGRAKERAEQYDGGAFFTICNYEQVLRDILHIERAQWDLIVIDEGQRIKNWEAKTSRVIKGLRSRFALVLSGTPLENRLEELYSVVELIDDRRLGPAFRFLHKHREVDESGRLVAYKNLDELRAQLAPVLLRRTRDGVLEQLPERMTQIVRIAPTAEQLDLHATHMRIVSSIVRKDYINEMDLLRLRKALLMCRMAADSSLLVTKKEPGYSSKLERLAELLDSVAAEDGRKAVLFSEWTSMLDLIEPLLEVRGLDFVRLDGSIPQKKRAALVERFQTDPSCKLFLTTNAGSTGLNLQSANTIINVDLPWNPAVLEQRIARAHRMGQKRPVQVYLLVTEQTIEENLLATLEAKQNLALAALDFDSDVSEVALASGASALKARLEVLLGETPDAPVDESERARAEAEVARRREVRREELQTATGKMLSGAIEMLASLAPEPVDDDTLGRNAKRIEESLLDCVSVDDAGVPQLTIRLPDAATGTNGSPGAPALASVAHLARSLARLLTLAETPAGG